LALDKFATMLNGLGDSNPGRRRKTIREAEMADVQSTDVQSKGQCLCGAVTIAVKGTPVRMAQCHCDDCRRATGTGHVSNAIFNEPDVTITGETKSFTVTADSGNAYTRFFCPTCGGRAYGTHTGRPGHVIVHVGMLDDSSWFDPQVVLYTRSRPPWDMTTEAVPNYETGPPPLAPAKTER
jgi:hypothetical protein